MVTIIDRARRVSDFVSDQEKRPPWTDVHKGFSTPSGTKSAAPLRGLAKILQLGVEKAQLGLTQSALFLLDLEDFRSNRAHIYNCHHDLVLRLIHFEDLCSRK